MRFKQQIKLALAKKLKLKFGEVTATDPNGNSITLYYDGDGILSEGDDVFIGNGEGDRIPAPDGNYLTEDRIARVEGGRVEELTDKTVGDIENVVEETPSEIAEAVAEVVAEVIEQVVAEAVEKEISGMDDLKKMKAEFSKLKEEFNDIKTKAIPEQKEKVEHKHVRESQLSKFGIQ